MTGSNVPPRTVVATRPPPGRRPPPLPATVPPGRRQAAPQCFTWRLSPPLRAPVAEALVCLRPAAAVFVILLGSAAFGMAVQHVLPHAHKNRDTRKLPQAVTGMLVTLAALVLGLLTS